MIARAATLEAATETLLPLALVLSVRIVFCFFVGYLAAACSLLLRVLFYLYFLLFTLVC